jgi:hypothetical protein
MTDRYAETYDLYLAAWAPISRDEWVDMLRRSLAETIVFTNPQQVRRGIAEVVEHLEGFQRRSPGGCFRMNNMVGWGSHGLAEWQLVDADGKAGFSGYDVVTFDDDGLISSILLFGNVEAQKLAWRRRDPVALDPT